MIRLETLIELKFLNSCFFELVLLLRFDRQFPVELFEATVSQSTVASPPSLVLFAWRDQTQVGAGGQVGRPGAPHAHEGPSWDCLGAPLLGGPSL